MNDQLDHSPSPGCMYQNAWDPGGQWHGMTYCNRYIKTHYFLGRTGIRYLFTFLFLAHKLDFSIILNNIIKQNMHIIVYFRTKKAEKNLSNKFFLLVYTLFYLGQAD